MGEGDVKKDGIVPAAEPPKETPIVPIPTLKVAVSEVDVRSWVESEQDPRFRALKEKIVKNLQLVSFDEFKESLDSVVGVLNGRMEKLAGVGAAILWDYKPHSSKRWVYELAKDRLGFDAEASYFEGSMGESDDFTTLKAMTARGVGAFIVLDDGVYSGEQIMNQTIRPILGYYRKYLPDRMPKIIVACPYVTKRFLDNVSPGVKQGSIEVIYEHVMPELTEILTDDDWRLTDERGGMLEVEGNDDDILTNATLTVFDHRIPDDHSFCGSVRRSLGFRAERPYRLKGSGYYNVEEGEFQAYKGHLLARWQELESNSASENTA